MKIEATLPLLLAHVRGNPDISTAEVIKEFGPEQGERTLALLYKSWDHQLLSFKDKGWAIAKFKVCPWRRHHDDQPCPVCNKTHAEQK